MKWKEMWETNLDGVESVLSELWIIYVLRTRQWCGHLLEFALLTSNTSHIKRFPIINSFYSISIHFYYLFQLDLFGLFSNLSASFPLWIPSTRELAHLFSMTFNSIQLLNRKCIHFWNQQILQTITSVCYC